MGLCTLVVPDGLSSTKHTLVALPSGNSRCRLCGKTRLDFVMVAEAQTAALGIAFMCLVDVYLWLLDLYLWLVDLYLRPVVLYLCRVDVYLWLVDLYLCLVDVYLCFLDLYLRLVDVYLCLLDLYLSLVDLYLSPCGPLPMAYGPLPMPCALIPWLAGCAPSWHASDVPSSFWIQDGLPPKACFSLACLSPCFPQVCCINCLCADSAL